jgi:hypothetical protein
MRRTWRTLQFATGKNQINIPMAMTEFGEFRTFATLDQIVWTRDQLWKKSPNAVGPEQVLVCRPRDGQVFRANSVAAMAQI